MEEQILAIADRLFMEKGFALTSTVDIAKEAGCNQALVHYYFRSKEKLFVKVFEQKMKFFAAAILTPPPTNASFNEMIEATIDTHFGILEQNPKLPFMVINELITNPKRIELIKQSISTLAITTLSSLQERLDKEYEKGEIRKIDARDLIINIISLNVFSFLSLQMVSHLFDYEDKTREINYLQERKKEIKRTIINSLRPLNSNS